MSALRRNAVFAHLLENDGLYAAENRFRIESLCRFQDRQHILPCKCEFQERSIQFVCGFNLFIKSKENGFARTRSIQL